MSSVGQMARTTDGVSKESNSSINLEPCSGTRDFFPVDKRTQTWLFEKFHGTAKAFGFQEYDAPVLEHQALYKRKGGEEITQQMYSFTDKEGAEVTLRPEMTPSLARMVLQLCRAKPGEEQSAAPIAAQLPLKWYSIPQCWRFETTQRGRKREHYQWNMDIIGEAGVTAEAELLAGIVNFFESIGITSKDVGIKVNSRRTLGAVLDAAGVKDEKLAEVCIVVDKIDKVGAEAVLQMLTESGLDLQTANTIVAATQAKSLEEFEALCPRKDAVEELKQLWLLAESYGIKDWLHFDASVVRGLAYYTGIVFEGFDRKGVLRAICGGGRYDRLLSLYGAPSPIPCVGFGFGDCVILELLKEKGLIPEVPRTVDFAVVAFDKEMYGPSLAVASSLRQGGKSVDVCFDVEKGVKKNIKYADKMGAKYLALVAPSEWNQTDRKICIKDLRSGDIQSRNQRDVPFQDLAIVDKYFEDAAA